MQIKTKKTWYTDKELLEIFPEITLDLPKILVERSANLQAKEKEIIDLLLKYKNYSESDRLFMDDTIKEFYIPELMKIERGVVRLERFINLSMGEQVNELLVSRSDIERAREALLEQIVPFQVKKVGTKLYKALCPFHNEKTPSFMIHADTNQYHCYGCGAHGDTINFIMEYYGYDFVEAVRFLLNR